jgi:hypothetical protein
MQANAALPPLRRVYEIVLFTGLQMEGIGIKLNLSLIWRDQVFLYLCRPFKI